MKKTHIVVVLDRSGSMASCKNDTIGGFNTFLEDQQKLEGEATITLAQFDNEYEIVYNNINIKDTKPLNEITFIPRGMTALLDAVGRTIEATKATHPIGICQACGSTLGSSNVVFVVITDGHENASKEFSHDQIMNMIKQCREKLDWEFIFLGAKEDAIDQGIRMGFSHNNVAQYSATSAGTQSSYETVSKCVGGLRSGDGLAAFSEEDRKDMLKK